MYDINQETHGINVHWQQFPGRIVYAEMLTLIEYAER